MATSRTSDGQLPMLLDELTNGEKAALFDRYVREMTNASPKSSKSQAANTAKGRRIDFSGRTKPYKPPRRPLNSWMAFRSYYAPMFDTFQQKTISGFLTRIWSKDPFKAKWAILAKAYSLIRGDHSKTDAPLDAFLGIACPMVNIVRREDYMRTMGWNISRGEDGLNTIERVFDPSFSELTQATLGTNLSAQQIVQHCFAVGFVPDLGARKTDRDVVTLAMATFIPASQSQVSSSIPSNNRADISGQNSEAANDTAWDMSEMVLPTCAPLNTMDQDIGFDPFAGNPYAAYDPSILQPWDSLSSDPVASPTFDFAAFDSTPAGGYDDLEALLRSDLNYNFDGQ